MRAESSAGEGTIWPTGSGIFTTWPSTDNICQLLIWEDRRRWPGGREGRSGTQGGVRREVHLGVTPAALPSSWETSAAGTAWTQAQMAGPEGTWLPARGQPWPCGTSGPEMAPTRPQSGVTVWLPALVRPWAQAQLSPHSSTDMPRFQAPGHTWTPRVTPQHSLPPGTQQCSPGRPAVTPKLGAVICTHSTNKPRSPAASPCPPTTRAGDARQPFLPTPDPSLSPWPPLRHTHPGCRGPPASTSAPGAPRPRPLRSPPHTSPGAPTGCPRTPPPGNAGAQEAFGITPLRSLPRRLSQSPSSHEILIPQMHWVSALFSRHVGA